ncbi:MAG: hypothetical protein VKJ24_02600, partial [Synechococcales bacterium]|nr:hypothetical protein [Synechococcales bacterium]
STASTKELAEEFQQAKAADDGYQKTLAQLKTQTSPEAANKPVAKPTAKPSIQPSVQPSPETSPKDKLPFPPPLPTPPLAQLPPKPPLPPILSRSQPIAVKFDPTGVNTEIIGNTLTKLGFTQDQQTQPQTQPTAARTIYYQSDLNPNDVKIIAFTFLRAGVTIAAIQPFPSDRPSTAQIEITSVPSNHQPLNSQDILTRNLPLP